MKQQRLAEIKRLRDEEEVATRAKGLEAAQLAAERRGVADSRAQAAADEAAAAAAARAARRATVAYKRNLAAMENATVHKSPATTERDARRLALLQERAQRAVCGRPATTCRMTAPTYVLVSYVFPDDGIKVVYVSGGTEWIAWELPWASVVARQAGQKGIIAVRGAAHARARPALSRVHSTSLPTVLPC